MTVKVGDYGLAEEIYKVKFDKSVELIVLVYVYILI